MVYLPHCCVSFGLDRQGKGFDGKDNNVNSKWKSNIVSHYLTSKMLFDSPSLCYISSCSSSLSFSSTRDHVLWTNWMLPFAPNSTTQQILGIYSLCFVPQLHGTVSPIKPKYCEPLNRCVWFKLYTTSGSCQVLQNCYNYEYWNELMRWSHNLPLMHFAYIEILFTPMVFSSVDYANAGVGTTLCKCYSFITDHKRDNLYATTGLISNRTEIKPDIEIPTRVYTIFTKVWLCLWSMFYDVSPVNVECRVAQ